MADKNNKSDEDFCNFRRRTRREGEEHSPDDDEIRSDNSTGPDIGLGHPQRRNEESGRREDSSSFSFTHFLQGHNSNTGARPKIYDNPTPARYNETKENYHRRHVNTPELASVLPDFVQDHLVVEQCYLSDSTIDIDNLPDFALSGSSDLDLPLDLGQRASNEQLPFDLTQLNSRLKYNCCSKSTDRVLPLDLAQSSSSTLPLDLAQDNEELGARLGPNESVPCDLGLGNSQSPLDLRSSESSEIPVNQSLPDFLSDGPIQCGRETEGLPGPEIIEQDRETGEIERLRRQLADSLRRSSSLEGEVRRCREAAHHREECLRRANSEIAALRRENANLRQCGGDGQPDARTQRVARELMAAATHAESSLRQLLSGVESLRLLASSLDQGPPSSRPHPSPSSSSHDFEPEDRAGPAL